MSYSGYDIEDALVLNRGSLDRGFGRCIVMRKFAASIRVYSHASTMTHDAIFRVEGADATRPQYNALDLDGIVSPGQPVSTGDVLVNKQTPIMQMDGLGMSNPDAVRMRSV